MDIQKILLVEDDPDIQRVALMALKFKGGWDVVVANDGEEGLEMARAEAPDVILLDAMMPKVDGLEMCRRLKADDDLKSIPVIFLTAKSQSAEVEEGLRAGAVSYLLKPFDPMKLADQVREIIESL